MARAMATESRDLSKYQERTSRKKYQEIFLRLKQNVRNNSRFKASVEEIHIALHDEPNITDPVPREAYEHLIQFCQEGKYKGLKCLNFLYYVVADAHYQFAEYSKNPGMLWKVKEMYSKSIQSGWKFSDDSRDVLFVNQICLYYSETSKDTFEDREMFLRDVKKMITSCSYAKGPAACICYFYQGLILWHHKKPDAALTSFRTSLKLIDNHLEDVEEYLIQHRIMNYIGLCHQDMHNHRLAVTVLDKIIAQYDQNNPNSLKEGLKAMYQRSLSEKVLGNIDKANSTLLAFINFLETNKLASHLKRTEEFQQYLSVAKDITDGLQNELAIAVKRNVEKKLCGLDLKKYFITKELGSKAFEYIDSDKHEDALALFEKIHEVKLDIFKGRLPRYDFREIHTMKAQCFAALGRYQEAIESFTLAQDVLEKDASLHVDKALLRKTTNELALCYQRLGYHPESLHFYKKVKEMDMEFGQMNDDLASAHLNIGKVQLQLGKYQESIVSFQMFLQIDKSEKEVSKNVNRCFVGIVKANIKLGQFRKAIEIIERGIRYVKRHKELADWLYVYKDLLGRCLLGTNQVNLALKCFMDAKHLSDKLITKSAPRLVERHHPLNCRNALYQLMCKRKLYNADHPDFSEEAFEMFCNAGLEVITKSFTFDNLFSPSNRDSDQELTRHFLGFIRCFMNERTSRFPWIYLCKNHNTIKLFHNSALISDYFRHLK